MADISTPEVRKRQVERLTPAEARELQGLKGHGHSLDRSSPAEASFDYAKEHTFERQTVARDYEVLTEALRHGRGHISASELNGVLALQESTGGIVRCGYEVATKESLQRERSMIASVNRGIGSFPQLGSGPFVVSDQLRAEQKHAV